LPFKSKIPKETIEAYRMTRYRVKAGSSSFVLRVGKRSARLAALMERRKVTGATFITACNPLGKQMPADWNRRANQKLLRDLRKKGYRILRGVGGPVGRWKGEASFLALGMQPDDAIKSGKKYRQNAVVWAGPNAAVWLLLLR
jgi:hypothetical protein